MSSPVTDLLNGFAAVLAGADMGLAYRPDDSVYQPGEIPLVKGTMRAGTSAQVVLNWVTLSDDIEISEGTGYLQVACIGAPNDADGAADLSWAIFQTIHGLTAQQFGQAFLIQCLRTSSVPMGEDSNTRQELADHYTCDVRWPSNAFRPF